MGFNLVNWTIRQKRKEYELKEQLLKESDVDVSLKGETFTFKIAFYQSQGNFYYQFIPKTSETLSKVEEIGKDLVAEELGKLIENKTSLIAPYDEDATGAGLSFKVLPSELKDYMLTPFK